MGLKYKRRSRCTYTLTIVLRLTVSRLLAVERFRNIASLNMNYALDRFRTCRIFAPVATG